MLDEGNRIQKLVMESMDVTSKVLLRELSGECTAEEAVATYRAFVSRVKGFLSAEEPSLSMIDGTALSARVYIYPRSWRCVSDN